MLVILVTKGIVVVVVVVGEAGGAAFRIATAALVRQVVEHGLGRLVAQLFLLNVGQVLGRLVTSIVIVTRRYCVASTV